jgi:hypothetical protein
MPTLIVENMPSEIYGRIEQLARARREPLAAEAVRLIEKGLRQEESERTESAPRLPDSPLMSQEISAPLTLPRPGDGMICDFGHGSVRLPEPIRKQVGEGSDV